MSRRHPWTLFRGLLVLALLLGGSYAAPAIALARGQA